MAYPSNQPDYVSINSLTQPQKEQLKAGIKALDDSLTRQRAERDYQNESIKELNAKLGVNKKIIRRMAKAFHNANYKEVVEENNEFENFYEGVMNETL